MNKLKFGRLFLLISCVFFNSCGLDEQPVLLPPIKGTTSDTSDTFTFKVNKQNGTGDEYEYNIFKGFLLYYKFFPVTTEGKYEMDQQSNFQSIDDINNFHRFTYYVNKNNCEKVTDTKSKIPLLNVHEGHIHKAERNFEPTIKISFQNILDENDVKVIVEGVPEEESEPLFLTDEDEPIYVRRDIREVVDNEPTDYYKSFKYYDEYDADIDNDIDLSVANPRAYLLIYVLSYGKDNLTTDIYSDAVCLNYIEIDLPVLEE